MGCSQNHSLGTQGLQVDLILIRLVDMGFNEFFSDPVSIQSLQMGLVYD